MLIEFQEFPPIGTNAFALVEPALGQCVVVDAPAEAYDWAVQLSNKYDCQIRTAVSDGEYLYDFITKSSGM